MAWDIESLGGEVQVHQLCKWRKWSKSSTIMLEVVGGGGGAIQIAYGTKTGASTLQITGGAAGAGVGGNNGGIGAAGIKGEFQI